MKQIINIIANEIGVAEQYVSATVDLLEGGATVPFISRYRKEATGSLDEVKVQEILDRYLLLKDIQHRKEYILSAIESQGKLTDDLKLKIAASWDSTYIEDLYLPYKPRRRTRAEAARSKDNYGSEGHPGRCKSFFNGRCDYRGGRVGRGV